MQHWTHALWQSQIPFAAARFQLPARVLEIPFIIKNLISRFTCFAPWSISCWVEPSLLDSSQTDASSWLESNRGKFTRPGSSPFSAPPAIWHLPALLNCFRRQKQSQKSRSISYPLKLILAATKLATSEPEAVPSCSLHQKGETN